MGIKQDVLDFIFACIDSRFDSYDGLNMLELGNQKVKLDGKRIVAKKYFENIGFKHVSFDINGKNGAIPIDLSKPIRKEYFNKFDIVTNSGTSEHVEPYEGQYECFRNIHLCTRIGGIMIHVISQSGSFPGHCPFYYKHDFFDILAKCNNYDVIEIGELRRGNNFFAIAGLIKKDGPFLIGKNELLEGIVQMPCNRKTKIKLKNILLGKLTKFSDRFQRSFKNKN